MQKELKMFINGKWIAGKEYFEVRSPYDNSLAGKVPKASPEQVEEAILAAGDAFVQYSKVPAFKRSEVLKKTAELILKNSEELAGLITSENGKVIKESRGEVVRAAETFIIASEEAKRIHGETITMDAVNGGGGRLAFTQREPIGVIAAITPYNAPLNLVAHKVAPALAAGNAVVLKPASATPIIALRLAELLDEAGLPKGVLNVVTGSSVVGEQIIKDKRIAMISFTGSYDVGMHIREVAGFKRYTFELGSNSAVIIDDDSLLDEAVSRCVTGAFSYAGQVCISLQRIIIHEDLEKKFLEKYIPKVEALKAGNPKDDTTDLSAMITSKDTERVLSWIKEAKDKGAKILCGGTAEGNVIRPAVIKDVTPEMKVFTEEVFGPVVAVTAYKNFDDAIKLVNTSRYGINTGIYTKDIQKAMKAIPEIKSGAVIVNDVPTYRLDHMPYGGVKSSGFGREGVKYAIEEMTEMKLVIIKV